MSNDAQSDALARLHAALDRLDGSAAALETALSAARRDTAQNRNLRAEVTAIIAELDDVIGAPNG